MPLVQAELELPQRRAASTAEEATVAATSGAAPQGRSGVALERPRDVSTTSGPCVSYGKKLSQRDRVGQSTLMAMAQEPVLALRAALDSVLGWNLSPEAMLP